MGAILVVLVVIALMVVFSLAAKADARWREFLDDKIAEWRARRRNS